MRFVGWSLVVLLGCVGDSTITPQDGGSDVTTDQTTPDATSDVNGDAEGGVVDPTWTLPLPAQSLLLSVGTDAQGFVYVVGNLGAPLTLGTINIASTQGLDILVMKLDPVKKQPVWAVTYGGTGDETAYDIAVSSAGLFIVGVTTSTTLHFGGQVVTIPSGGTSGSFVARLDPSDGSVGWAISPDVNRTGSFDSFCEHIGASGINVSVACSYSGSGFGWDPGYPAWNTGASSAAVAVFRFKDSLYSPQSQWTTSFGAVSGGAIPPSVTLDVNGDTWVSGVFTGLVPFDNEPAGTQLFMGTSANNPFLLKIATSTQNIAPAIAWAAQNSGILPSQLPSVLITPSEAYVAGSFGGMGNFGLGPVTSQGSTDIVVLGLNSTTLATKWQFELGGTFAELARGLAVDSTTSSTYVGISWGSSGLMFGGTALAAPPASGFNAGLGKLDTNGLPVSILATTTTNATVFYENVIIDAFSNTLYGVGRYSGTTTFDDGTQASGNMLNGNGFLVHRRLF